MSGWLTHAETDDDAELREKFARYRAQFPGLSSYEIAAKCYEGRPDAPARAGAAAFAWERDPAVLERINDIKRVGVVNTDINEAVIGNELIALARDVSIDAKDRIAAYKEAASVFGFTKSGTNVNVAIVNRVMKVKDHGSDDEWEARLEAQQQALTGHVVTPAH